MDLVLGQPGQADDWEDDDNVRDENLSAHRAAAALLVVMSAPIGVLHPLEAVRDGTDTSGFDVMLTAPPLVPPTSAACTWRRGRA